MNLFKAMATVGGITGLSRVAGFIRDILTASILGAGPIADAFFVALKLPNLFRRVTAEGAFSVSFVPFYSQKLEKEGRERADDFASNIFMVMLSALFAFTLLVLFFMPVIIHVIAPGFEAGEQRYDLAVELSRITFPYLLMMSLVALLGGLLNAHNKFAPFAFAPVLFNVTLIGALLLSNIFETAGHAMAYGVLIAGILQFIYLFVSAFKANFRLKFALPQFDNDIKHILKLMGPGVLGAGVMQINLFVDLILASFLDTGSISYLYYADRLNQLPLGVVGIAVGTALLPMLSKALTQGNHVEAKRLFNRAMEYCLLLALPAAAALVIIPNVLIEGLFQRGAFDASDTQVTSLVLMFYALGLPSYISIKIFSTAHWARSDTGTPVKISIIATIWNIALSIIFIQFMGVAGIALGTALTGWMQVWMHMRALKDHDAVGFDEEFKKFLPRVVNATAMMVTSLLILEYLLVGLNSLVLMCVLVMAGLAIYGVGVLIFGLVDLKSLKIKTTDEHR